MTFFLSCKYFLVFKKCMHSYILVLSKSNFSSVNFLVDSNYRVLVVLSSRHRTDASARWLIPRREAIKKRFQFSSIRIRGSINTIASSVRPIDKRKLNSFLALRRLSFSEHFLDQDCLVLAPMLFASLIF